MADLKHANPNIAPKSKGKLYIIFYKQSLILILTKSFPVTECTQYSLGFQSLKCRMVEAEFTGGDITPDGDALLLREMDRRLGLLESADRVLQDGRDRNKVVHSKIRPNRPKETKGARLISVTRCNRAAISSFRSSLTAISRV